LFEQCVFEAYKASQCNIRHVSISGKPVHLLMGANQERLRAEELKADEERNREDERVRKELDRHLRNPELLGDESAVHVDLGKLQGFAQKVAQAKLDVLCSPNSDLIDLDNATCSYEGDAKMIRSEIRGCEEDITTLICQLIRDCICGIGDQQADVQGAKGALQLSLDEPTVDLSTQVSFEGSPLLLLRLFSWLRQAPKVQRLVVSGSQLTAQGVQILRSALEEGLLAGLQSIDVCDNLDMESLCALAEQVTTGDLLRTAQRGMCGETSFLQVNTEFDTGARMRAMPAAGLVNNDPDVQLPAGDETGDNAQALFAEPSVVFTDPAVGRRRSHLNDGTEAGEMIQASGETQPTMQAATTPQGAQRPPFARSCLREAPPSSRRCVARATSLDLPSQHACSDGARTTSDKSLDQTPPSALRYTAHSTSDQSLEQRQRCGAKRQPEPMSLPQRDTSAHMAACTETGAMFDSAATELDLQLIHATDRHQVPPALSLPPPSYGLVPERPSRSEASTAEVAGERVAQGNLPEHAHSATAPPTSELLVETDPVNARGSLVLEEGAVFVQAVTAADQNAHLEA
jgi:hypothetical protein